MNYDSFQAEWLGRRVDYDRVFAYQCVDLILQYIYECYGINNGVWGNAIDYWNSPSAPLFAKFFKTADGSINKGDISIFNGLAGNPYGHIGIATGGQTNEAIEILEQNGTGGGDGLGPNAIRTRWVNRGRLAGLLRPITVSETPQPVPVPEPVPVPRPMPEGAYTVPSGRRYTVIKAIVGYATATKAGNQDGPNAILHAGDYNVFNIYPGREDLINLKSDDGSIWSWINSADNVPDPIPEPIPVPPPVPAPIPDWPAGSNPREATPAPPVVVAPPPEPPPLPTPTPAPPVDPSAWKDTMTFKDSQGNPKVIRYVALDNITVHDLEGHLRDTPVKHGTVIHLGGTFVGPDGVRYGRTPSSLKNFNWYGVDLRKVDLAVYDNSSDAAIRKFLGTAHITDQMVASFAKLENTFEKAFDIIKLKRKK